MGLFCMLHVCYSWALRQHCLYVMLSASSLSAISQLHSICRSSNPNMVPFCNVNQFCFSIADSIKQCPKSTKLSRKEWFITKQGVFASVCSALQCKINSFIFHIAGLPYLIFLSAFCPCILLNSAALRQPFLRSVQIISNTLNLVI